MKHILVFLLVCSLFASIGCPAEESPAPGGATPISPPLMEGDETHYDIEVDEALNMKLTQHREIARFELYRHGEIAFDSYEVTRVRDGYRMSVSQGASRPIKREAVDALTRVIETYDLFQWDGFQRSNPNVLDGEGFRLEIEFTDGSSITATGDNAFPPHYFDAIGDMQAILEDAQAPRFSMGGLIDLLGKLFSQKSEWIVGTDIDYDAVGDFYYTYETSTFPPEYQRYRFYVEDGKRWFFHERREGERFPLEEADITATGTLELTDDQWARFCECVEGGTVKAREELLEDGASGPWLYLYWDGDEGRYQEFAFASYGALLDFEAFCEELAGEARA